VLWDPHSPSQGIGKLVDGIYVQDRQGVADKVMSNFILLLDFQSSASNHLNAETTVSAEAGGQSASGTQSTAPSDAAAETRVAQVRIDEILKVLHNSTSCTPFVTSQSHLGFHSAEAYL
jgi:hypothetical protein